MATSRLLLSVLFLAVGAGSIRTASAQEWLTVQDPRQWWTEDQGTIEEAVISIRPKGVYMEYGMYLTFSARGTGFEGSSTPLEVALFFRLPEEAVVTDSWLWIEDEIIRATIMDQWTASEIYEEVVNRQRDPSILFKRGQGSYELRIYPMPASGTRKVKLTFLMPTDWSRARVASSIPTEILRLSRYQPKHLSVIAWPSAALSDPQLEEFAGLPFVEASDPELGEFVRADLPSSATAGDLTFSVSAPLTDGIFVGGTKEGPEGWYQMAFLPEPANEAGLSQKVAFVVDYDGNRTNVGRAQVLDALRSELLTRFSAADSFNIFYSRLDVRSAADAWLPADAATVDSVFATLTPESLGTYSNLPALLAASIGFASATGSSSVMLLSSSDGYGDVTVADDIIDDVRNAAPVLPPIHVADFADRNLNTYWVNGQVFTANSYLFDNLAEISGGRYLTMRDPQRGFERLVYDSFVGLRGTIGAFDLHTTLEGGFCFDRFNLQTDGQAAVADRPVIQIGRYYGDFPFVAEMSGLHGSVPFSQRAAIAAEDVHTADTTLVSFWTGTRIRELEGMSQTNDVINQVINYSLDQRVLSLYTAFLALEPSRGGEVCYDCVDESEGAPVATESDEVPARVSVTAYPNPFRDQVTIDVQLTEAVDAGAVTATVYNVMGQAIRVLRLEDGGLVRSFSLDWDGKDAAGRDVASGTYYVVIDTPAGRHTVAVVKVG